MNYFKNLLAKSIRQRRFLFTMIAAFLIGVGLAFYLTFMEPVNVQAEITIQMNLRTSKKPINCCWQTTHYLIGKPRI